MTKTSRAKRNGLGCYNREGWNATIRVHIKQRTERETSHSAMPQQAILYRVYWSGGLAMSFASFEILQKEIGIWE